VQKGAVPSGITPAAEDFHSAIVYLTYNPISIICRSAREVAHLAGDDSYAMATPCKLAGKLVMSGSARLVYRRKRLVN
jgi:hypothetical protein